MNTLKELININRETKTDFTVELPNFNFTRYTKWIVKWDKDTGAVSIDFKIIR